MISKPTVPIVLDTNVLVPSLYAKTRILEFVTQGNLVLLWNGFIYAEAVDIIHRLSDYYKHRGIDRRELVIELLDLIFIETYMTPEMPSSWPPISPDRNDDPFLFAGLHGGAEYIISSDKRDMLSLGTVEGIPIGPPTEFFTWVKGKHPMKKQSRQRVRFQR